MSEPFMEVWSIREANDPDRKSFWKHVGRAFWNRDGSINVLLDALPLSGKLQIRKPKDEGAAAPAS